METENAFAIQAKNYLYINGVLENGCGYIPIPVSSKIRDVINLKYLTLFAVRGEEHKSGRDTAFIVSKDFRAEKIFVEKQDYKRAVGLQRVNVNKLSKQLGQKISFVGI